MAQIVAYGAGSRLTTTSGTSHGTVAYPTGYTAIADDLAVLSITQNGSNSAITTPAGYTLIRRTERTTTHVHAVYRRKLGAGTAAPTVTTAASSAILATLHIFRGVDTTTAEDVASVSNTGTSTTSHTGPDIGTLVTPETVILSMASSDDTGVRGITLSDNVNTSPFILMDSESGEGNGFSGNVMGSCTVLHHQIIPNQTQIARTHSFVPMDPPNPGGGWIVTTVALRPADPTTISVPRDLAAAVRQQTLRTWGQLCSPTDTVFGVRLSVQVFNPFDGGDNDVWSSGADGAFWDLGQWSGPGRWEDVTSLVRGLDWTVGADQPGGRPRIGTATVDLVNQTGDLSPWATTGHYTNGGSSWLRSGLLMRIASTSTNNGATTTYSLTLFTGIVEEVTESSQGMSDAWVTVSLVDTLSTLATYNSTEQAEQGGGEGYVTRLYRLLNDAGWPYGVTGGNIPSFTPAASLVGTTLAGERLAELYLYADSVGFELYCSPDGSVIVNHATVGTATRTFSNAPAGIELPFATAQPYANNQRILNVVIGARVDGHEIEVQDGASTSRFGRIDTGNGWPRRDLICQSDATVAAIVNDVLAYHAQDDSGIAQIVVDADMRPGGAQSIYTHLTFMQLFDNTNIRYVHPTNSAASFTQVSYTEGMHHQVTKVGYQMKWVCTVSLARFPS